jgi:hypothetical protein
VRSTCEQRFKRRPLALKNLFDRDRLAKPGAAIDLRESLGPSGPRRPFHLEHIACEPARVAVTLGGPDDEQLSARLTKPAKRTKGSLGDESGFLLEFALCSHQRILALVHQSLRYGPGAVVLGRPKRAPGVNKENLPMFAIASVEENACAALRHD